MTTLRIDIPHVWDVDGKPQGVRHELVLDGDTLIVRDIGLRDGAVPMEGFAGSERRMPLIEAVHALLNMSDAQRARMAELPEVGKNEHGGGQ